MKIENRKWKMDRRRKRTLVFSLPSPSYVPFSQRLKNNGQSTIEFTFAMMVTLILIFALFMVFRWVGLDLASRRFAHDKLLKDESLRPEQQLVPDFYKPRKLDTAYRGFDLK